MDGNLVPYNPRTVEEVYKDFKGRRAGMIKALTNDVDDFFQQCDPGGCIQVWHNEAEIYSILQPIIMKVTNGTSLSQGIHWKDKEQDSLEKNLLKKKENVCLYGFPNEHWEVNLPAEEVPPELPEPALGINFARDGMQEKDWLSLVAVHSDAWLISIAFYFGARFGFDRAERKHLFDMINDLPTVYEAVTGKHNVRTSTTIRSSNKSKSNPKLSPEFHAVKYLKGPHHQEDEEEDLEDEEEDEHADALCGACGENYGSGEFWICCDVCEKWFHGKCVKITPAKAEHIKQYKCPSCSSSKRSRHS